MRLVMFSHFPHLMRSIGCKARYRLGYVIFTLYRIPFASARKSYRIGLLFTVISARFPYWSEAAPRRSLKWSVTYRIGSVPYFSAVWIPFRTVSEVNKWVYKWDWERRLGFSSPNHLGQPLRHDVCERFVPVLCRCCSCYTRIAFCVGTKGQVVY